jgi:hypothetical protein
VPSPIRATSLPAMVSVRGAAEGCVAMPRD